MRSPVWPVSSRLSSKPHRFASASRFASVVEDLEGNIAMPNPKRRHSKQRTAKRRSHDFLTPPGLSECPNCHERKLPHRACGKCGEYKGRAVLATKEAS